MGSCGCGDFDGVRWAVTVGKYVLAVSDYDGCNNGCSAPLGFTLHLMTKRDAQRWHIEPTGEWRPGQHGFADQFLNLFSQDDLAAAADDLKDFGDLSDYDTLRDLLQERGLDLMRAAWKRTLAREAELRTRFGEKKPFGKGPPMNKQPDPPMSDDGIRRAARRTQRTLERWLARQDYDEYNDTIVVKRSVLVRMWADLRNAR